jgi:manganese/iron transport system ATP-binding protein
MSKDFEAMPPAHLELEHVTVTYATNIVLDDVTFSVPAGAQVAVVGPNGAGKSTLFKALVGLAPLRKGKISIHNTPFGGHQECVAYVPQREEIDWKFPVTVEDVVLMGRSRKFGWLGHPGPLDREVVKASLDEMNITNLAKNSISDLSGGQQQRVFLARALAQEPHILLMDEPFTGVDAATQETTLKLIQDLKSKNVTVLVSTHDLNMASSRFELSLLLNHHLVAFGISGEVFRQENILAAFGPQVLFLNNAIVVDECCPPGSSDDRSQI